MIPDLCSNFQLSSMNRIVQRTHYPQSDTGRMLVVPDKGLEDLVIFGTLDHFEISSGLFSEIFINILLELADITLFENGLNMTGEGRREGGRSTTIRIGFKM